MSRSYRKYKGLGHNMSHSKQGKAWKKIWTQQDRARAKAMDDDNVVPRPCHKSNCYDGKVTDKDFEWFASRRSEGYSRERKKHKFWGK